MSNNAYQDGKDCAEYWINELPEENPELVKKWLAFAQKADLDEVYSEMAIPSHKEYISSFMDGVRDA